MVTDSEFLNWLGDRLVHVYGESENVDFVLKVRRLAQAAAQSVAQPVVDQEPASLSHNGSCGSQVSGKPVSAEADRYKRALEAIIANPGGASAKRIATLALGLDGTEQVSAEAKPLPVGWLPNLVDGELLVPTASAEAGKAETVAVSGEVSDVAIDSAISTVWEDWEDDIDRRRELARAVLALAKSK